MTTPPSDDPVRHAWARRNARRTFSVQPDPDREASTPLGREITTALKAAGLGGTPMTDSPKDAA